MIKNFAYKKNYSEFNSVTGKEEENFAKFPMCKEKIYEEFDDTHYTCLTFEGTRGLVTVNLKKIS
jgi:hypothetical protein